MEKPKLKIGDVIFFLSNKCLIVDESMDGKKWWIRTNYELPGRYQLVPK